MMMEVKHKYEVTVNGMEITLKDKSHVGIFRQFWAYFMNLDMDKTIKTIESVGIRTSDSEYFEAKNGSKKKNILVKEGYWIYTHLNPQAMQRTYEKFISGWEVETVLTETQTINMVSEEKPKLKNIYKKSIAMALCRRGHDIEHTMRNRENPKYQVFVFKDTPVLIKDLLELTK
ncbi:hypothetical protein ACFWMS_23110 [Peribacillus butanolivorans]|uniref:hypothetical protein n=1 Tax=Peribacillus butanolivorans TaxID=421767 RepID=UPI00366A28B8